MYFQTVCSHYAKIIVKSNKTATISRAKTSTNSNIRQKSLNKSLSKQDNADMWSIQFMLLLLFLYMIQSHATLVMTTGHSSASIIEPYNNSFTDSIRNSSASSIATSISSTHFAQRSFVSSTSKRKRHRKRNSNWYDYYNYNDNTIAMEWVNPCGGAYYTPTSMGRKRTHRPKQIFNQLKHVAGTEYRVLNNTHEQKSIDIRNMQMWSLHNPNYKFLPKLKPNSTIALKRWYRNLQTYVASFAYLRRVQIKWDRHYLKRESAVSKELKDLLLSSRSMLCEIEMAVNRTNPALAGIKQLRLVQLPEISREDMNKRLKLRSKRRPWKVTSSGTTMFAAVDSNISSAINEADTIDMRFVKHHYYEFLRTMWQLLRRDCKRERGQRLQRRQQHYQHHQHEQQQLVLLQHQQQLHQGLALSLALTGNRKEFNEVSKPRNDVFIGDIRNRTRGKRQQSQQVTQYHQKRRVQST